MGFGTIDLKIFNRNLILGRFFYKLIQGHVSPEDEAVVMILCQWAVTNKRSGEHRAFIAAKLLEQRQADIVSHDNHDGDKEDEEAFYSGPPVFQQLLFRFLDTEAPYFTAPQHLTSKKIKNEVANLILLFHELMSHEVRDLLFKYLFYAFYH